VNAVDKHLTRMLSVWQHTLKSAAEAHRATGRRGAMGEADELIAKALDRAAAELDEAAAARAVSAAQPAALDIEGEWVHAGRHPKNCWSSLCPECQPAGPVPCLAGLHTCKHCGSGFEKDGQPAAPSRFDANATVDFTHGPACAELHQQRNNANQTIIEKNGEIARLEAHIQRLEATCSTELRDAAVAACCVWESPNYSIAEARQAMRELRATLPARKDG